MKNLYILQKPDSIVDITTNSSSEIFVIGKHKTPELVDQIIDSGGWRWWFGERKILETVEQVREFIKNNGHVVERLLGLYGFPEERYSFSPGRSSSDDPLTDFGKEMKQYDVYSTWDKVHKESDPEKKEVLRQSARDMMAKQEECREKWENAWLDKQDLEKFVGTMWYACGEDNELADWDEVHSSVPGNYARVS